MRRPKSSPKSLLDMQTAVQTLILGTAIGGVYALMGVGLNLIFGVMRVANFAHGALYMIGGYAAYYLTLATGAPMPVAVIGAMVVGGCVGYFVNAILLRPVYRSRLERPSEFTLIVTFALSLMATSAAAVFLTPNYRKFEGMWPDTITLFGFVSMSGDRAVAFVTALILLCALLWLVHFTDLGRGWRALTQNRMGADIVGVDVFRLANLAFATSGALAAAAGAVLVPLYLAYPTMGESVIVKSFVIVVLGGLGSIAGSLVGGFLLGWAEALGSVYIGSGYTDIYGLVIMLVVLLFLPRGLFGISEREV